jgi:hypothetical protein
MVVNFRTRGINRDTHKLAQTHMLNLKKKHDLSESTIILKKKMWFFSFLFVWYG